MRTALVRASLLCLVTAFAVSTGSGQRPKQPVVVEPLEPPATQPKGGYPHIKIPPTPYDHKDYTAFPNLKSTHETKAGPNGSVAVEDKSFVLPPLPIVADNDPPLRKVLHARVQAGLSYLYRVKELERVIGVGSDFERNIVIATEVYSAAADLEDTPAKRVPWYEARVRTLKEMERHIKQRTAIGTAPPQQLDYATFQRLKAEAELLKLKAEAEQAATPAPVVFVPTECTTAPRLFRRR